MRAAFVASAMLVACASGKGKGDTFVAGGSEITSWAVTADGRVKVPLAAGIAWGTPATGAESTMLRVRGEQGPTFVVVARVDEAPDPRSDVFCERTCPRQVQFCRERRIHGRDHARQRVAFESAFAFDHETGDQRRQRQHMEDVVAIPGHQHRAVCVEREHVAERMVLPSDETKRLDMSNELFTLERRDGMLTGGEQRGAAAGARRTHSTRQGLSDRVDP